MEDQGQRIEEKNVLWQRQLERLCPYQLFGEGTYFGDTEVLSKFSTHQRHATVRCEAEHGGSLLQLHKDKLHQLMSDFPHCQRAWHLEATRHEVRRQAKIQLLTKSLDLYELATLEIQRAVVAVWQRKRKGYQKLRKKKEQENEVVSATCDVDCDVEELGGGAQQIAELGAEVQDVKSQMITMSHQVRDLQVSMSQVQESLATIAAFIRENPPQKAARPPPSAPGWEVSRV
ncbi:unnamed protein product [Symbiodinium sp. CCMP2456]|nr:unnamed protein product [Symbiodinium sp. CCMP2456]